jgi:post-segregation antitoxin (ccd killing protein)
MANKRNVVLYVDSDLVRKTRELGFNLSKTFENYMKQLLTQNSALNTDNNSETTFMLGSPGVTVPIL